MRLFQNAGLYRSYVPQLRLLTRGLTGFAELRDAFLADRYGACHFLQPVLNGDPEAFVTNGDDPELQQAWARENGISESASLADILLAQIEHHRADVFYNLDPMRYGDDFLARLPGCVKRTIAWRAAPSSGGKFFKHDLVVNNFPARLATFRSEGARTAYFFPGVDPEMAAYADNQERPIDLLFVGAYSQLHRKRGEVLEQVAKLSSKYRVSYAIDTSRLVKLAETPLGLVSPLRKYRRPATLRKVASGPVFGRALYQAISSAKIVLNGSAEISGNEHGNMRVWETLGGGSAMVSEAGIYPEGISTGRDFAEYRTPEEAVSVIEDLLNQPSKREAMAESGRYNLVERYDKSAQWKAFQEL